MSKYTITLVTDTVDRDEGHRDVSASSMSQEISRQFVVRAKTPWY